MPMEAMKISDAVARILKKHYRNLSGSRVAEGKDGNPHAKRDLK